MSEKNKSIFLQDVLYCLLTTYPTYLLVNTLMIVIGYYANNIMQWIGPIILFALAPAYFFTFVKNKYINPVSKKGYLVFEIIVICLKVIAAVFVAINLPLYFTNLKYHGFNLVFPIDMFVMFAIYVIVDVKNIMNLKKIGNTEKKKYSKSFRFMAFVTRVFAILMFYSSLSFLTGLQSIAVLKTEYAFGYLLIALLMIAPFISTIASYVRFKCDRFALFQKISVTLSIVLIAVLMIYQMIDPNFMINSAKMFLPLDFIGSLALGPIWLTFINIIPLFFLIAQNKKNQIDNREEKNNNG